MSLYININYLNSSYWVCKSFITFDCTPVILAYSLSQEDSPSPNTARQVHNLSTFPHPGASGAPFCYILRWLLLVSSARSVRLPGWYHGSVSGSYCYNASPPDSQPSPDWPYGWTLATNNWSGVWRSRCAAPARGSAPGRRVLALRCYRLTNALAWGLATTRSPQGGANSEYKNKLLLTFFT